MWLEFSAGRHDAPSWNSFTLSTPAVLSATRALLAGLCLAGLLAEGTGPHVHAALMAAVTLCVLYNLAACVMARFRSAVHTTVGGQVGDLALVVLMTHAGPPFAVPVLALAVCAPVLAYYEGGRGRALGTLAMMVAVVAGGLGAGALPSWGNVFHPDGSHLREVMDTLVLTASGGLWISAEQARRRHSEAASALRAFVTSLAAGCTTREVVGAAIGELSHVTGTRNILVALENLANGHVLLLTTADDADTGGMGFRIRRLPRSARDVYFSATAESSPAFRAAHPCHYARAFKFRSRDPWIGQLFLLDPAIDGSRVLFLQNFEGLLKQFLSVLSSTRHVPGMRSRAAARERARLGRELHDGVIQELATLDLELELVRRTAPTPSGTLDLSLRHVQERLRTQLRELRLLQQRARSYDVDSATLLPVLSGIVNRFGREYAIDASFVSRAEDVHLPPRVCGEIVRIVQEALVNVRRHSGADRVVVEFGCEGAQWKLRIEDDGRGIEMSGRGARAGRPGPWPPAVIEERVRSIGGTLTLSKAARRGGARLEVAFARRGPWPARMESEY